MIVIGLTGGIASGKSTVSGILKEAGAVIVDADKIVHEVQGKGRRAWEAIVEHFGEEVLLSDGELNREFIGNIVFNDPKKKEMLSNIVLPFVFQEMDAQIKQAEEKNSNGFIILDVPLLIESGMQREMKEVIVVYVPEQLQIERLIKRDNLSETDALARINSQMPIEEKKKYATIVVDNSLTLEELKRETLSIHNSLKEKYL